MDVAFHLCGKYFLKVYSSVRFELFRFAANSIVSKLFVFPVERTFVGCTALKIENMCREGDAVAENKQTTKRLRARGKITSDFNTVFLVTNWNAYFAPVSEFKPVGYSRIKFLYYF